MYYKASKVGVCGEISAFGARGWDLSGVDSLENDDTNTEREGGVLGGWACGGIVEGVLSSGELSLEK